MRYSTDWYCCLNGLSLRSLHRLRVEQSVRREELSEKVTAKEFPGSFLLVSTVIKSFEPVSRIFQPSFFKYMVRLSNKINYCELSDVRTLCKLLFAHVSTYREFYTCRCIHTRNVVSKIYCLVLSSCTLGETKSWCFRLAGEMEMTESIRSFLI